MVGFDEMVQTSDVDFTESGLKVPSVIRVGRLAVVADKTLLGAIGQISRDRLERIKKRLAEWLVKDYMSPTPHRCAGPLAMTCSLDSVSRNRVIVACRFGGSVWPSEPACDHATAQQRHTALLSPACGRGTGGEVLQRDPKPYLAHTLAWSVHSWTTQSRG